MSDYQPNGGISRYTVQPHTTKRRTTTNLKTKNNQNCQKIKLYGSPTTKELKKKHSSRPVGGAETGSQGGKDSWEGSKQLVDRAVPHLCADKPGGTTGEQDRLGSRAGKESLKTSGCKNLWGLQQQEKLPASQENSLERTTGS